MALILKPKPEQCYCVSRLADWLSSEAKVDWCKIRSYIVEKCGQRQESFATIYIGELLALEEVEEWAKPSFELILKELCPDGDDLDPAGELNVYCWW